MNQNPPNTETKPAARLSGLALCKLHFEEAAKAHAAEQAKKPTAEQFRAAEAAEQARRSEERSRQKSSAELIAEANRYAPGGHRARLLTQAHFRQQEERAAELMARELQAKAAAAAPKPAADAGEAGPWARLAAKMEEEGCTPENRAEYGRLAAIDDQRKAESQQRWDRIRARVRASEAAAAKAPSAGRVGTPAKSKAAWAAKVRAAARA